VDFFRLTDPKQETSKNEIKSFWEAVRFARYPYSTTPRCKELWKWFI